MDQPSIVPIVEGHGEVEALPILLRRIAEQVSPLLYLKINPPMRVKSGSFLNKEDYFEKYVQFAAARARQSRGFVLILLDCDDDCPAEVGPKLLQRAKEVRSDIEYLIVLAYREYEAWFLASISSITEGAVAPPENPEAIRGAKGWLKRHLPDSYDPIIDQARLSRRFDMDEAENSASFRRFRRKLEEIFSPYTKEISE